MRWLLNIAYAALLLLFAPLILVRAWRQKKYREGWTQKLWGRTPQLPPAKFRVWLHAVSLGEVHLLEPLIREIARRHPDWECVVSTTTKSGWEAAERKFGDLVRFYCPLDFSWAVDNAIRRIQPDLLVLSELELWPNLIASAQRRGARVAVVNGRLSEKSFRGYSRLRWLASPLLGKLDCVAAQNEIYAQRFRELGAQPEAVHVTGSIKFDGAVTDRQNSETKRLRGLAGVESEDVVMLAGSTQDPEELLALETFRTLAPQFPHLRLLLAPRHPERFDAVAELLESQGVAFQRRSKLPQEVVDGAQQEPDDRVLLVDSLGELRAWWGLADVAFVGGSMGSRGGQNMIEPAAYGAAVCFGPKTRNFQDVVQLLLTADGASVIQDGQQLTEFTRRCLADRAFATQMGGNAQSVVREQLGAAARTVTLLESLAPALRVSRAA